ncbi:MAG: hypothetical protein QUV35_12215 [Hydrogenophaga sp.]|uniref:hypothetical protein n=1 Tax=Hydrogenophaga sp. TaxID=1904254 RepID=UPI002634EDC8|nr:hypothetical protein [Hydrogenophaga sp.]MDM7943384.1 hypothetical protein [Hydrogenophaga sp.]
MAAEEKACTSTPTANSLKNYRRLKWRSTMKFADSCDGRQLFELELSHQFFGLEVSIDDKLAA